MNYPFSHSLEFDLACCITGFPSVMHMHKASIDIRSGPINFSYGVVTFPLIVSGHAIRDMAISGDEIMNLKWL